MKTKDYLQDVRIRDIPTDLVRRLRAVLLVTHSDLAEWFTLNAAKTADKYESQIRKRGK